jgi:hypothetical protein
MQQVWNAALVVALAITVIVILATIVGLAESQAGGER